MTKREDKVVDCDRANRSVAKEKKKEKKKKKKKKGLRHLPFACRHRPRYL